MFWKKNYHVLYIKKKITFVIHSFTCIWLPSNPDHHNHSRGPSISHRAVEKSFFFFFKHRCPFPQNNRTKLLLVAHRRHFTHIFILQIWLLPTSLTSYLGCFLFTVLSHSFLTTLCLSAPGIWTSCSSFGSVIWYSFTLHFWFQDVHDHQIHVILHFCSLHCKSTEGLLVP